MKSPVWLTELYRQWKIARGNRTMPRVRSFRRDWDELLDDAKIKSAEDRKAAVREAEREVFLGNLKLHRLRGRPYIIQKIEVPLEAERWLVRLFAKWTPGEAMSESRKEVVNASARHHTKFPRLWKEWCALVQDKFSSGKNVRPLYWHSPEKVGFMMDLVYRLTSLEWEHGTLIREISVKLDLGSKGLEHRRRQVEACLSQMFCRPMQLQSMGVVITDSRVQIGGILTLYFANGEVQEINKLKAIYGLSLDDLMRATHATTPARRLLTVENSKTTLRRLSTVNEAGDTLLAACAFPSRALLRLMELLPDLQVFHFGDTDPAGFHILSKIREASCRTIFPFLMDRREAKSMLPLTEYDQAILKRLLDDPGLRDVANQLRSFIESGCKGDFEQETIGLPDLVAWPFFGAAIETATGVSSRRQQ